MNATYRINTDKNMNIKAGATAGLLGGAVMMLAFMLYTASIGLGLWMPLESIGATFYGAAALEGGIAPILTGIAIHAVVSACLGIVFASSLSNTTGSSGAVALGICYGVAVWAVMTFIVLNLVNITMRAVVADVSGFWFLNHLVFGACLGSVPRLRRVFARGFIDPRSTDYLDRAA